jgi:hypothetical protein
MARGPARRDDEARRARPAIDPPGRFTKCDRCRKPLDAGVYRLQRGHISGTGATWFICEACDRELIRWMQDGQPPVDLSGTK